MRPERQHGSDVLAYALAVCFGLLAGWVDIKVGDLLFTAMIVLGGCIVVGFIRPQRPWRWVLTVGIFVPLMDWLAYFLVTEKPSRAQIYESFLAFMPGIAGAYGAALGRGVVNNLFPKE